MSQTLQTYEKKKEYLICVDSDGCAMDTMDVKHIKCFGPCMVKEWGLEKWQDEILKRWNDINLYTMTRGINRFKGLIKMLSEVSASYVPVEDIQSLDNWCRETKELSNNALLEAIKKTDSLCLKKALAWSEAVNKSINALPDSEKLPFEGALEGLKKAQEIADVAIVSSANLQAVEEEWEQHGLLAYTDIVMAQNAGTKAYCIGKLLEKGYDPDKVLMIGDAPGDAKAAEVNKVLYYPVLVRQEKESWQNFISKASVKFLDGTFKGEYQEELLEQFEKNLSGES